MCDKMDLLFDIFVLTFCIGFLVSLIELHLSQWITIGFVTSIPISSSNPCSQATSLKASANAKYSALYIDMEISTSNLLCQFVNELPIVNLYTNVDLCLSRSLW